MGTRGTLGGVAEATLQAGLVIDAAGPRRRDLRDGRRGAVRDRDRVARGRRGARPDAGLGRLDPGAEGGGHGDPRPRRAEQVRAARRRGGPRRARAGAAARRARGERPGPRRDERARRASGVEALWDEIVARRAALEQSGALVERRRASLEREVLGLASARAARRLEHELAGSRRPARAARPRRPRASSIRCVRWPRCSTASTASASSLIRVLGIEEIRAARELLAGVALHTPMLDSRTFSDATGATVLLKAENLQKTGLVQDPRRDQLPRAPDEHAARGRRRHVERRQPRAGRRARRPLARRARHGLHADRRARSRSRWRRAGTAPRSCSRASRSTTRRPPRAAMPVTVRSSRPSTTSTSSRARARSGSRSPRTCPAPRSWSCPLGGGGLLSGIALALRAVHPSCRIVGVQAAGCAAYRSSIARVSRSRRRARARSPTASRSSGRARSRSRSSATSSTTSSRSSEDEIVSAMVELLERAKLVVEGAGAVGLAALLAGRIPVTGKTVVCVLSGGNIDAALLQAVVRHGLTSDGRYLVCRTKILDRPGSLARPARTPGRGSHQHRRRRAPPRGHRARRHRRRGRARRSRRAIATTASRCSTRCAGAATRSSGFGDEAPRPRSLGRLRHARSAQRDHRRRGRARRARDDRARRGCARGGSRAGAHRRHGRAPAPGAGLVRAGVRGLAPAERQRRADRASRGSARPGMLASEIALTNTHSVGVVRDALCAVERRERGPDIAWSLPVVGETWDGLLNDVDGQHVTADHLREALAGARGGAVAEGAVGGGTGMICHGFKGGIGTASRVLGAAGRRLHGRRARAGEPRPARAPPRRRRARRSRARGRARPAPGPLPDGAGSIIVILATDAPLLPGQCERVAQRATIGVARAGGGRRTRAATCSSASRPAIAGCRRMGYSGDGRSRATCAPSRTRYMTALFDAAAEATRRRS